MKVLVLLCAAGMNAPDCQRDTAISQFYVPGEVAGNAECMLSGMSYAMQSGQLGDGRYPKIICEGQGRIAAAP